MIVVVVVVVVVVLPGDGGPWETREPAKCCGFVLSTFIASKLLRISTSTAVSFAGAAVNKKQEFEHISTSK